MPHRESDHRRASEEPARYPSCRAVRRRNINRQRDAVFLDGNMDFDAPDLLAAIDATVKATRRRATGSTIDDYCARFRGITAGEPPAAAQPVEQPAPEAEAGPASEQSVERVERDVAEASDRPPLHATETNAPNRHDSLAQRCPGQRRFWPRSHWPDTLLCHGIEFQRCYPRY